MLPSQPQQQQQQQYSLINQAAQLMQTPPPTSPWINPFFSPMMNQRVVCTQCKNVQDVFVPPTPLSSDPNTLDESFVFLSDFNSPTASIMDTFQSNSKSIERIEEINYMIDELLENGENLDSILHQQSLCGACLKDLFEELSKREDLLKRECDGFEKMLKEKKLPSKEALESNANKYKQEMDKLRNEEFEEREKILLFHTDRQCRLGRKAMNLQNEINAQQETEKGYWKAYFEYLDNMQNVSEDNRRIQLRSSKKKFNPAKLFSIHENPSRIMMINGLRMGTLRTEQVSWDEINAGWGLCALLITMIAQKLSKFKFSKYKITPKGSHTTVKELESGEKYDLFYSSIRNLNSFNQGMKSFLFCLKELISYAAKAIPSCMELSKNVHIDDDKISERSIIYSDQKENEWTGSLRMVMVSLKFLQKNVLT
ncbi:hypothetical protein C9374_009247 [Naegleria lovaniensis]|uniref:Atg6 BARA domain-containing protein n=1 Tax=Naegleria lovaniensis TaxID=51637 RepID=A0AA88KGM8_NAELO|nr:uncharacterized protein C9374_009247 [Naegleria lovaniensis]KAG2377336.1 hypothetical protein C9374_009247 [Naegleria lovaniensis]